MNPHPRPRQRPIALPLLAWRLRTGLGNPQRPPGGSDPKEAAWKVAGEGAQNEPSPLSTRRHAQQAQLLRERAGAPQPYGEAQPCACVIC